MKTYNRKIDGKLQKGQMFLDSNLGWPGIVTSAERTKNYGDYNIIECTEVFGFAQDMGSKYANEVTHLLTEEEFNQCKTQLGFGGVKNYFKGKLIGY